MRRSTVPPRPRSDDSRLRAPEPPKRKIFNCIVDDTALIAGAKKSTRDGIRKWITQDAIRLFVPLHTLAQLNHLKTGQERYNADARDALMWLDDITSSPTLGSRIQLEGVDEAYATWAEVEQFMLPETLLSMEPSDSEDEDDEDDYRDDLESSLNALDISDGTSMSSVDQSPKLARTPEPHVPVTVNGTGNEKAQDKNAVCAAESPSRTARNSTELPRVDKPPKNSFPPSLRPLFNHILWRIHQESNPDAALDNFILLTNDPAKQAIAQKFGIRAKRLEQLRDAVMREDREFKNHLTVYKKEMEEHALKKESELEPKPAQRPKSSHSALSKPAIESDDEDYVLIRNAPRGPANSINNQRVFDPNEFGRSSQQHSPRGGRGNFVPRGRGGPIRGSRGASAGRGRGGAYIPPQPLFQPQPAPRHDPNQPIDPDSFTRPATRGNPVRGGRRTLWEPN